MQLHRCAHLTGRHPRTPALEAITLHYTQLAVASQQLREIDHAQASLNAARKLQAQLPGAQATEVSRLLSLAEIELHMQARQSQQARQDLSGLYRNPSGCNLAPS